VARAPQGVAETLARLGERVGYRSKLLRPALAAFAAAGQAWDDSSDEESWEEKDCKETWVEEAFFSPLQEKAVAQRQDLIREGLEAPAWDHFPLKFHLLELYGGEAGITKAAARMGLVVGPVLELKRGFDAEGTKIFLWLLWMVLSGRIWVLIWEPPCTTASLARKPGLRDTTRPMGFNPFEAKTMVGTFHVLMALCLASAQDDVGGGHFGEQPAFGHFRHLEWWKMMAARGFEVLFDFVQLWEAVQEGYEAAGGQGAALP